MRNSFLKTSALIIALTFLGACEQETMEATPLDNELAILKDLSGLDGCGWVFELKNGSKLQFIMPFRCGTPPLPETNYENPFENFEFEDGKQVRIAYKELENISSICMAGKIVEITRLQSLD